MSLREREREREIGKSKEQEIIQKKYLIRVVRFFQDESGLDIIGGRIRIRIFQGLDLV